MTKITNMNKSLHITAWTKKKLIIYSIISSFLSILILIGILEATASFFVYIKYGVPGKTYGLWRYDEFLGAQHRENAYNTKCQTNNFGFRCNSSHEDVFEPKPAGSLRIITYGGSTTFCYNLSDADTWPSRLELQLRNNRNPKDQVLNGGAILWSIGHLFVRAKKDIPQLKPDYIILYTGINEHANASFLARDGRLMKELIANNQYGEFAKNMDQNRWIKRNSVLVKFFDYYLAQQKDIPKSSSGERTPDPYILENYLHVLKDFIDLAKSYGAVPVFIIQAHGNNNDYNKYLTSYSRFGAETAKNLGAIVIDAQLIVEKYPGPSMDLFYETGVHYSKEGASLLAELIYNTLFIQGVGPKIAPVSKNPFDTGKERR